jgi:ABC-type nitrate/sulfonate/bicarbonate transport system substrate-binding protein
MPASSSSEPVRFSRRTLISAAALAAAGAALGPSRHGGAAAPVRMTDVVQGSAGALWRPLIESGLVTLPAGLSFSWIGGSPGQVQLQLTAGAVDMSVFGAIGVAELAPRGFDIAIFGPALNNHGRWIVRGDSRYRTPHDLIGRKIATQLEASDTYRHARLAGLLHGIDLKKDFDVVFGPSTANVALFRRGDVDAVLAIEPTATRLVAGGAREIARVGDMWRDATGDAAPLFLVGLAAHRDWIDQNKALAAEIAGTFAELNRRLRAKPQLIAEQARAFGIPAGERAAIELLPQRMADVYGVDWDRSVFANMEHQIDAAVQAGIISVRPARPVHAELQLEASGQ